MLTDYHIHSNFSHDGTSPISEIVATAVLNGMQEIAITDHFEILPNDFPKISEDYFKEIEKARKMYEDEIIVRSGIEIANAYIDEKKADSVINGYPYDFVLSAIHYSNGEWLDYNFNEKVYLQEMEQIVEWGNFDCLAHFDLPCRYSWHFKDYEETTERILRKLSSYGNKGLELNISGMVRGREPEIMPSKKILEMWHDIGGRVITVGTDSHIAGTVGKYIREGQEILLRCGFAEIATFDKGNVNFKQIEFKEWE